MTKDILTALGIGTVGIVGFLLLVAFIFTISTAFTAVIVALVWNVFGLHEVFNADTLGFWHVVAVAAGINILRSIFSGNRATVSND